MGINRISFDEAKAKIWQAEVRTELEMISELNEKVGNCMQEMREEGDPLTIILKRTGSQIQSLGNSMRSKFFDAIESIGKAVTTYAQKHQELIDEATANAGKM